MLFTRNDSAFVLLSVGVLMMLKVLDDHSVAIRYLIAQDSKKRFRQCSCRNDLDGD
jgi:hypothetical protein